jgi:divalent metal cation (Fe/Co/Zn/Cd) transporter
VSEILAEHDPSVQAERDTLRRRGLRLVWIGEIWNTGEVAVGLWSGLQAGSVALIAFGLDSVIEVFAGAVAIWSLRQEWGRSEAGVGEGKALRTLGATFFLLSAYIALQAIVTLLGWVEEPRESLAGIALLIATAISMTLLFRAKSGVARKLGSEVLRKEAIGNLFCDLQDLTVLAGLGLYFLFGWWWADPLAALLLIPFLLKEGMEAFRGEGP